jgi:hypothetical protein
MEPSRQKCEGLYQAFDMGIFAPIWFEQQSTRHPGIFPAKLRAHVAEIGKLSFV